jgi:hypothetical protein
MPNIKNYIIIFLIISIVAPHIASANMNNKVLIAFSERGISEMKTLNLTKDQVISRVVNGANIANNPFGIGFKYSNPHGGYVVYKNSDVNTFQKMLTVSSVLHKKYPNWKVIIFVDWNYNIGYSLAPHASYTLKPFQGDYGVAIIDLLAWQQSVTYNNYIYGCDKQTGKPGLGPSAHEVGHVLGAKDMSDPEPSIMNFLSSCYYNINSASAIVSTHGKYKNI